MEAEGVRLDTVMSHQNGKRSGIHSRGARRTVIIGENMTERVIPYARKIGADYYKAKLWSHPNNWMKNNEAWIRKQMREASHIIDIGPDVARRAIKGSSPYYEMEKTKIKKWNYPHYTVRLQP